MSKRLTWIGCVLALTVGTARASAQIDTSGRWRFTVTPDLWALSLHGRVGVGPVATNANVSFHDLLKALRFAVMANAEVRKGRWFGDIDVIYASLGKANVLAVRGDTGTLELTAKISIIQPVGGYTIGNQKWSVDFLGGFRAWDLRTTLDVDLTKRPSNAHSIARGWPDATAGFRFHWLPYQKLRVLAGGDGGGGGSHGTWQAYGVVGYDVWSRVALGAGYRYLFVNYEDRNYLLDADLRGFGLGASIHW